MNYDKFIQPKKVTIGERTFTISQIPAVAALPLVNTISESIAKNGLYGITMLPVSVDRQIISYTALSDDVNIVPDTDQLFNDIFKGRVSDAKALVIEMVKENFGFLITGDLLERLELSEKATESVS